MAKHRKPRAGHVEGWRKRVGVALLRREGEDGAVRWLARYVDPDSGKTKHKTVPADRATDKQRAAWAAELAEKLRKREDQIDAGAPTKKNVMLSDAIERYYGDVRLRPATLKVYRAATDIMLEWARSKGIRLADDLRGASLASLKSYLVNMPAVRSGKGEPRGVASVNRDIRGIKAALEHLRRNELVPFLSHDSIRDNLKTLATPTSVPEYLRPATLVKLIDAASRHDSDVFDLTQDEKARGVRPGEGTTPRFAPILPYLSVVLLTGMRADEARLLRWEQVELDPAPGGITLRPEGVKTNRGRVVDLVVSPLLRELLMAMKFRGGGARYVFGDGEPGADGEPTPGLTRFIVEAARKRLMRQSETSAGAAFGGPRFTWLRLRKTCATFLANAPGIFAGASAYREARQLGHKVDVAEKHYLGVVNVDPSAKTLEAAMGIEDALRKALRLAVETSSAGVGS
jgi:integrase